jgi:hypothetical protein
VCTRESASLLQYVVSVVLPGVYAFGEDVIVRIVVIVTVVALAVFEIVLWGGFVLRSAVSV